jgi:hypothetical protein
MDDQAALAERVVLERVSRADAKNAEALALVREATKGLVRKISLLQDELAAERRAWELYERQRYAQFEELTLQQN